jgi:hypothetical protein
MHAAVQACARHGHSGIEVRFRIKHYVYLTSSPSSLVKGIIVCNCRLNTLDDDLTPRQQDDDSVTLIRQHAILSATISIKRCICRSCPCSGGRYEPVCR